jgi:hypothetical protein
VVFKFRPVVSMKNGADGFVVFAPGGIDAFPVGQGVWAKAAGATSALENNAVISTA